jgi:ribonuclease VapC
MALLRIRRTTIDAVAALVDDFVVRSRIQIIPITAEICRLAIETCARFGRGDHPARLNMGDCFAYACARSLGVPLLCKGGDFAQTDIALA